MNNAVKQWREVFGGASLDYIVYTGLKMKRMMSQKFWACPHALTRSPVRDVMPTPNRRCRQTNEYRTIMGKAYYIKW
jgi:hypothetical protein